MASRNDLTLDEALIVVRYLETDNPRLYQKALRFVQTLRDEAAEIDLMNQDLTIRLGDYSRVR